ncbi:cysteine desulfurase family protein [Nocardioides terrisoli]|uniref:cysteine desulfurase family protein n=1 Tax=Nocardioides terrisoli TaxID=3388267 RepID=UPI00287BB30A|nr:aminotransferase class V-fold PLP-dependent enzyme [Nocardioides marmorisolisilvae]
MTHPPTDAPIETYLDTASGEPLHPAALEVIDRARAVGYADPRRLHQPGRRSRMLLDNARASIAESLGVRTEEVTFTPSGTHAVHLGLLGLVSRRPEARVLAGAVEHSAVMHAGRWHADRGGRFETLPVDPTGRLEPTTVAAALEGGPISVLAVQTANHEVGTIQPIAEIAEAAPAVDLFVDACASGGRLALPDGWATAALSAHKWGGPAGVGVLLVRGRARWHAPFPVDDRADDRGIGFEDVAGALAAAAALRAVTDDQATTARQRRLVDRIRGAVAALPDVEVVGDPQRRLPHLVTFSCLYIDGEALVTELDRLGFSVASGSACTASTLEPSHVLAAMGVLTHGNVRVSLTRETSEADVERFLSALPGVLARLRSEVGL